MRCEDGCVWHVGLKNYLCCSNQNHLNMAMLGLIVVLFVAAIICSFVLPNEKVSKHEKDWEV